MEFVFSGKPVPPSPEQTLAARRRPSGGTLRLFELFFKASQAKIKVRPSDAAALHLDVDVNEKGR